MLDLTCKYGDHNDKGNISSCAAKCDTHNIIFVYFIYSSTAHARMVEKRVMWAYKDSS